MHRTTANNSQNYSRLQLLVGIIDKRKQFHPKQCCETVRLLHVNNSAVHRILQNRFPSNLLNYYFHYIYMLAHQFSSFRRSRVALSIYAHTKRSHVLQTHSHTDEMDNARDSHDMRASNLNSLFICRSLSLQNERRKRQRCCEHEFINSNRKFNYTSCLCSFGFCYVSRTRQHAWYAWIG